MKKSYIKPETLEVKFEAQGMIAASLKISDQEINTAADGAQLTNKGGWDSSNWE
jgi:hypothetical protein